MFQLICLLAWLVIAMLFWTALSLWLGPNVLDAADRTVTAPAAKAQFGASIGDSLPAFFAMLAAVLLVDLLAVAAIVAASTFVIVRRAAGYPAKMSHALRFALARTFPLFGW